MIIEALPSYDGARRDIAEAKWGHVRLCSLENIHKWPNLREHSMQLSTLIEWWHTPTSSFHIPTREVIVTLLMCGQIFEC